MRLSVHQRSQLHMMACSRVPWCLRSNTFNALMRMGLIRRKGVCKEHHSAMAVITAAGRAALSGSKAP